MTLQEILQILGGIGVIASMIYVGIQIRNNARAMRAATYQQLSALTIQGWHSMAHNGETMDIVLRAMDDFSAVSRVEKARFRMVVMAQARSYENAWFQFKIGTLRKSDWKAFTVDFETFFSTPGTKAAWPLVKNRYNEEFTGLVDEIFLQQAAAVAHYKRPPPVTAKELKVKNNVPR